VVCFDHRRARSSWRSAAQLGRGNHARYVPENPLSAHLYWCGGSLIILEQTTIAAPVAAAITQDEFQALEQKVLRAVEIVRREREARIAAEAEAAALREQIDTLTAASNSVQTQITTLNQEREAVRLRVEKMLQQMDELL